MAATTTFYPVHVINIETRDNHEESVISAQLTSNPKPSTPDPGPWTLNPRPSTPDPGPWPWTLNPEL